MDMGRPEGMASRRSQHLAYRAAGRDRIVGRHDRPEGKAALPIRAEPRPQFRLVQHPFCKFSAYGFAPMGRL
jgi:hypothetical protein